MQYRIHIKKTHVTYQGHTDSGRLAHQGRSGKQSVPQVQKICTMKGQLLAFTSLAKSGTTDTETKVPSSENPELSNVLS